MPGAPLFLVGGIYWFVNPKINSPDPHPHVCVGEKDGTFILLFCGTSNFEGRKRHFELNHIAPETLVRIQSNPTNSLTKDTYLNCNDVQLHSLAELNLNTTITHRGSINESEMYQIRNAVEMSELLEANLQAHILSNLPEL